MLKPPLSAIASSHWNPERAEIEDRCSKRLASVVPGSVRNWIVIQQTGYVNAPDQTVSGPKGSAADESSASAPPAISLPKGGGAIRGMGEKFAANPVSGTGSMSVPIATSPGRSGFGPQLTLSYDSGAGNGPFGLGWSLSLPSITRKTDKGLPKYQDADESDVFILSGAEDLAPVFKTNPTTGEFIKDAKGNFVYDEFSRDGYLVRRYRPRIEGLFARIERWTRQSDGDVYWRSISKDNIITWYGKTEESRIANPEDSSQIFSWLICQSYDDKGNAIVYEYQPEDSQRIFEDAQGQLVALAHERNRNGATRSANRYVKRIKYCNRTPNRDADWQATDPTQISDWMFDILFDYGEGHYTEDAPNADGRIFAQALIDPPAGSHWPVRQDPFSTYRAGFEVRTYRLCRRVLMFHHIPDLAGGAAGYDGLVRSTEFAYNQSPIASFITQATQSGYVRQAGDTYLKKSLPPLTFEYSEAVIQDEIETIDAESLQNLPVGANGLQYQWLDLDGEGLSGVLSEQDEGWYYKRNVSPISITKENGKEKVVARFEPLIEVATEPSIAGGVGARHQFLDLAGDGNLDVVQFEKPVSGFFERTQDERWESFIPFESTPNLAWNDPNLRFVDLTGDGHPDILITEDDALTWYPSLAEEGFGTAIRVPKPRDEEEGPAVVFADGTQAIFVADLSGDGLTDIARIRNGEVCYWPNLGYGRFGAKVTMDNAPWFDAPDQFDQKRIRLADIDGSGTTDIIYLERNRVAIYRNECGNGWGSAEYLASFPAVDDLSSVTAVDLLGNGTACLVWSSPLPGNAFQPMRYIDLMGGQKPHLLVRTINNLGAETVIEYAPSTKFYLNDKKDRKPWISRLPFPVHVVERVETYDLISRNRFVSRYAYHHGFYDGIEREFRGFGMVEQFDTEELAALTESADFPDAVNIDAASYVPTVLTRSWFHTGAYIEGEKISRHFEDEYYNEGDESEGVSGLTNKQLEAMLLPDTELPETLKRLDGSSIPWQLTTDEIREACRALKGAVLRREIYALDGTDNEDRPYSATEQNYTVELLQPQGENKYAVFFTHPRESIDFHYERKLAELAGKKIADPRVTHAMTLEVDGYGDVLKSVAIGYGRRPGLSPLQGDDRNKQEQIHVTYTENEVTNPIEEADDYRAPLPCEARTYELLKIVPDSNQPDITNLFGFDEMVAKASQAGDGGHELPYEDIDALGATANHPYRRLIEQARTLYRQNNLSGPLPLGQLDSLALPGESYKLAFTSGLAKQIYVNSGKLSQADVNSALANDGKFVHSDGDANWWIPSGKVFLSPNSNDTIPQELAYARQHFFLPHRFRDPFHTDVISTESVVAYDGYDLLIKRTRDALDNVVTVDTQDDDGNTAVRIDYRVLQPYWVTDPNGNRARVAFDALGMVVGTAVMGKPHPASTEGDSLDGFEADLTEATMLDHLANPLANPHAILGRATTRLVYDLFAYQRTQDQPNPQPAVVYALARETHDTDLEPGKQTKMQHSFSYSDGFGREIQKKIQAEPGPVVEGGPVVNPRWVGSGWTIFNNKGKPVRQYEPFFDDSHDFKFGVVVGVSPVLFYDPVERVVATLHPNHTYEKVVFDPWQQTTYDVNDTVTFDPKTDDNIKEFFMRLPNGDYLPTWYGQRSGGQLGSQEQDAATKAAVHANTPSVAHADSLGRPFLTIAHNKFERNGAMLEETYFTRAELDIEGNQHAVIDAKDRVVMRYDFDMLGNRTHQASMEAGERWMLTDVAGNPLYSWDSRDHQFRITYDPLRRATDSSLREGTGAELLVGRNIYGETRPNPETNNLRGKVVQLFDQAGVVTSEEFDFKGNPLRSVRTVADDYKKIYDWNNDTIQPSWETFSSSTSYDALNRPISVTAPDDSVYRPTFNEANLLDKVDVDLRGAATPTHFVTNIDYNAKGQRTLIEYGNKAKTTYEYDDLTFRLVHLRTTRPIMGNGLASLLFNDPGVVQDLHYTYDPAGNITRITDDSLRRLSSTGPADNAPSDYTYDASYRLIEATGREHIGQTAHDFNPQNRRDYDFVGLADFVAHPNDLQAMRRYSERYEYDAVGNFAFMRHVANGGSWIRGYEYNETSLIEQAKQSNRLTKTTVGNHVESYTYKDTQGRDVYGCMTSIDSMTMVWDFHDQLRQVDLGGGGTAYYVYDSAGQRVRKVVEKNGGALIEERIYLRGFEIYRKRNSTGLQLERETLHVMDDKQRIALVETKTKDTSVPVSTLPDTLIRFQFGNHLGSASLELDETGQMISYEEYHPYGTTSYQVVRSGAEVSAKRYRYTGKERDEETGLGYHGARYYAMWLGRWVSADPRLIIDGLDLFRYSHDSPLRFKDEEGTASTEVSEENLQQKRESIEDLQRIKQDYEHDLKGLKAREEATRFYINQAVDLYKRPLPPRVIEAQQQEEKLLTLISKFENAIERGNKAMAKLQTEVVKMGKKLRDIHYRRKPSMRLRRFLGVTGVVVGLGTAGESPSGEHLTMSAIGTEEPKARKGVDAAEEQTRLKSARGNKGEQRPTKRSTPEKPPVRSVVEPPPAVAEPPPAVAEATMAGYNLAVGISVILDVMKKGPKEVAKETVIGVISIPVRGPSGVWDTIVSSVATPLRIPSQVAEMWADIAAPGISDMNDSLERLNRQGQSQ